MIAAEQRIRVAAQFVEAVKARGVLDLDRRVRNRRLLLKRELQRGREPFGERDDSAYESHSVANYPMTATTAAVIIKFSVATGSSTFQPKFIRRS